MKLGFKSIYHFQAYEYRRGPLLWERKVPNLITTQGLNDILTQYFKGAAYTASPFIGLIDNDEFGSIQASDTAAKITDTTPTGLTNQWKELIGYDETERQTLSLGTAAAGSIDNVAVPAEFTFNTTVTVKGAFISTSDVISGTAGVLYGAASYGSPPTLGSGNVLVVKIQLTAVSV